MQSKLAKLGNPRNWVAYAYRGRNRIGRFLTGKTYIFIERRAGIGDIVCTFPAVLALREKYPKSHIVYATRREFMSIVRMGQCADEVVEMNDLDDRPWMAESDFDYVFRPTVGDEKEPPAASVGYLVDQFSAAIGVEPRDRQPRMFPPKDVQAGVDQQMGEMRRVGKPLVGIHAGPTWAVKEWVPSEWERLVGKLDSTVIQFGSDVDTGRGPVLSARIAGSIDWVNRFSLEETAAAISKLDLFVGVDSGLLHIAGAVGTPVVGLYGAIRPMLSLPPTTPAIGVTSDVPCLGCHHLVPPGHWKTGCPNDIICMKELKADRVLDACAQLLKNRGLGNVRSESNLF